MEGKERQLRLVKGYQEGYQGESGDIRGRQLGAIEGWGGYVARINPKQYLNPNDPK